MTVGPNGQPTLREFGNVRPAARGLVEQAEVRQPLVDTALNEKDNTLTVTAEMPGVDKEDILVIWQVKMLPYMQKKETRSITPTYL